MSKGERIRELRKLKGISQEEMAKLLKTTKQTISKYENGVVSNIPSDRIEAMAVLLDTTPEYILGWDKSPEEQAEYEASILMDDELMDMIREIQALNKEQKKAVKQMIKAFSSD